MPIEADQTGHPLVDIRDVRVNPDLPKAARVAEFIRQIRNPYQFRCGTFCVTATFLPGGPSLEDCLARLLG